MSDEITNQDWIRANVGNYRPRYKYSIEDINRMGSQRNPDGSYTYSIEELNRMSTEMAD